MDYDYIWDEKRLLQIISENDEYSRLFDNGEFDTLLEYMKNDGYMVSKQFFNGVLLDLDIKLNDGVTRANDMKYTIIGTQGEKRPYGDIIYDRNVHDWVPNPNGKPTMKYIYRYAGLNNKGLPTTLTMNWEAYSHRVYFKDLNSAQEFLDKFVEYPKIKNRENQVNWKIIPLSKRNSLGSVNQKSVEMKEVNSPVGRCYMIA